MTRDESGGRRESITEAESVTLVQGSSSFWMLALSLSLSSSFLSVVLSGCTEPERFSDFRDSEEGTGDCDRVGFSESSDSGV